MKNMRMYNDIPNWKKEITYTYYNAINTHADSLSGLYIKLEQIATRYMDNGEMPDGEELVIHLSNMATLKMVFHNPYSEIFLLDKNKDTWSCILSKEQSANIEKHNVLEYYDKLLTSNGLHIGPPAPKELLSYLSRCNVGQMLNFEQGNSYICIPGASGDEVLLQKVSNGTVKSLSDIQKQETLQIPLVLSNIQQFYQNNCKADKSLSVTKVRLDTFAQEYLNKLYGTLPLHATKRIVIGNEVLYLTREGYKKYAWKNANGKAVSEDMIKLFLGHIHTRGIEREYKHTKPSIYTKFNDQYIEQKIDHAIKVGNFADVYTIMEQYVMEEKQSLTITNKGYRNEDGNYIATGYVFKYDEETKACRLFKVHYENNDLNGLEFMPETAKKADFIEFYQEIYNETRMMLASQTLDALEQTYGLPKTQTVKNARDTIAKALARKNISIVNGKEIETDIKSKEDIHIGISDEAMDNLLDSFLDTR